MTDVDGADADVRTQGQSFHQRLDALGLTLSVPPSPRGRYLPAVVDGNRVWVSGHTGRNGSDSARTGVVGRDVTLDEARASARQAAVNILAAARSVVDARRLDRVLFLRGYICASATFRDHPAVIDAASDVLESVIEGAGHARAAIGVASLPGGACVELEAVFGLAGEGGSLGMQR